MSRLPILTENATELCTSTVCKDRELVMASYDSLTTPLRATLLRIHKTVTKRVRMAMTPANTLVPGAIASTATA